MNDQVQIKVGDQVLYHTENTMAAKGDLTLGKVYTVESINITCGYVTVIDDIGDSHEVGVDSISLFDPMLQITSNTFTTYKIGAVCVMVSDNRVSYTGLLTVEQFKAIAKVL